MSTIFDVLPSPDPVDILPGVVAPDSGDYEKSVVVEYMPGEVMVASPLHITLVREVYAIMPDETSMPCLPALFLLGLLLSLCCTTFRSRRQAEPIVIQAEPVPITDVTNTDIKITESKV